MVPFCAINFSQFFFSGDSWNTLIKLTVSELGKHEKMAVTIA